VIAPTAIQRFTERQRQLIHDSYDSAWRQGVAGYQPDADPAEPSPAHQHRGEEASLTGVALLRARSRRAYHPPTKPHAARRQKAITPALASTQRMTAEAARQEASGGKIPVEGIAAAALGMAVAAWAESNSSRLDQGASVAWAGEQAGYAESADLDGHLLQWQSEDDDNVCVDCEGLEALGPLPLEDFPTMPGDGATECNVGCRCAMEAVSVEALPGDELAPLSEGDNATLDKVAGQAGERLDQLAPDFTATSTMAGDAELGRAAQALASPDVNQVIAERDALYAQAERVKPEFDQILHRIGEDIGAAKGESPGFRAALEGDKPAIITAPLKAKDARATEKVADKYKGDWAQLKDIVRGTVAVPSQADLAGALQSIQREVEAAGWRVVGIENRYSLDAGSAVNTGATSFGYRDVSMHLVSPDGHVAELQLNTIPMMQAKEFGGGHKLYEEIRGILERPRDQPWTRAEEKLVADNTAASRVLYGAAEVAALG